MTRSSWNPTSPDVIGVEFEGVGAASNILTSGSTMRALRFKPQRTGEVDQVAVYCGGSTVAPTLTLAHFASHRYPWMVELIPASGFDPGAVHRIDQFGSTITTSTNAVDEVNTAPDGDELTARNDGLLILPSGGALSATVEIPSASTFDLTRHVISIAVEYSFSQTNRIRRIDANGGFLWTRNFVAQSDANWHIGEAYIENGFTADWQIWTPQKVREFAVSVGSRRWRVDGLNTVFQYVDELRMHVDSIPERRAGVAVIEPTGPYSWVTGNLHIPSATGTAAQVVAGQEYVVLVRRPAGDSDYAPVNGVLDWQSRADMRMDGVAQHYTALDWDSRNVSLWESGVPRELTDELDGVPCLALINDGATTVDTQPYIGSHSGVVPFTADGANLRPRHEFDVPAGTTEYRQLAVNVSLIKDASGAPDDFKSVAVELLNATEAAVIAGPFLIDEATWDASPDVGSDSYGDPYKRILIDLGAGFDLSTARARFTLNAAYTGTNAWRIGALLDDGCPGTGDQTALGSATGHGYIQPNPAIQAFHTGGRLLDLEVALLSQPPEITGTSVTGLDQAVSGGVCAPCSETAPTADAGCVVSSIPYARVCWSASTLPASGFGYYEVQRLEHVEAEHGAEPEWVTVALLAPTGSAATGAGPPNVPTCWDDWSMHLDSEVCWRVRQARADGALSDFAEEVCLTLPHTDGAELVITAPDDPTLNVAFPEVHDRRLPVTQEWEILDADVHTIRSVYGRDKHIAFRPLERLGLRFKRRLLLAAMCTPDNPCLDVIDGIHTICHAPVGFLVVRDQCGNRWYATVSVPTVTQLHDPSQDVGDIWIADIVVTELATPVIGVGSISSGH